jgi:hypothetical protein
LITESQEAEPGRSRCMDGKVAYVKTYENEPVLIQWGVDGCGWGEITFYYEDGKLKVDNECMSKDFLKKILCALVDKAELKDP